MTPELQAALDEATAALEAAEQHAAELKESTEVANAQLLHAQNYLASEFPKIEFVHLWRSQTKGEPLPGSDREEERDEVVASIKSWTERLFEVRQERMVADRQVQILKSRLSEAQRAFEFGGVRPTPTQAAKQWADSQLEERRRNAEANRFHNPNLAAQVRKFGTGNQRGGMKIQQATVVNGQRIAREAAAKRAAAEKDRPMAFARRKLPSDL